MALSKSQARRIALAAQLSPGELRKPNPTANAICRLVDKLNLLQIDSVNVLSRSHYLPVYSRLGPYDRSILDMLTLTGGKRRFFEYWGHEASFLPLALYPLFRWRMEAARKGEDIYSNILKFGREEKAYVEAVIGQIRSRGPLTARELKGSGKRIPEWWGWSPGKAAMEYLFWVGDIAVAARRNFERVYDIAERVIPSEFYHAPEVERANAVRELMRLSLRALGVATFADLRDYFRLSLADAKRALLELEESGEIEKVNVEGWRNPAFLARDAVVPRKSAKCAALLSPFDPLVWERARAERLFDFTYRIEIYTPSHKRKHGYYVLPFLFGERIAARTCLKADRASGTLIVNTTHGENDIDKDEIAQALAAELHLLKRFLGLEEIQAKRKGDLATALRKALTVSEG